MVSDMQRSIAQPLLQEASSRDGMNVNSVKLLGITLCMVVLISINTGSVQDPTITMFNTIPSPTAPANRFLPTPLQNKQSIARRIPVTRAETTAQMIENTWQGRLDKALLNLDVEPQERLSLLQEALGDQKLSEDLRSAVGILQEKGIGKGHPEFIQKLWPKGTTARADLEGLTALRKQVPEVLQGVRDQVQQSPASFFPQQSSAATAPPLPDLSSVFGSLQTLVSDTDKQKEILEETKDLLRSTPKGLETPQYEVMRTIEGPLFLGTPELIELRKYENFTVARTNMETVGFAGRSSATGFNTLASYLFGNNQAKQEMKMTMPVEMSMSTGDEKGSMAFVLPKKDASEPPTPLASTNITIEKVPARLVATKPFPGIVTDEEVQRQKDALLEAIAADGSLTPVDNNQVTVLQYNSPLTVPWRRRNELAIVVTEAPVESMDEAIQLGEQSNGEDSTEPEEASR